MLKKNFLVFFALLLSSLLVGSVLAENIGYIVKTSFNPNADESVIINVLENYGHTVDFLDDDDYIDPYFYDLIIVGGDVTNIKTIFNNQDYKTLFLSSTAAKNAGLTAYGGTTTHNKITISDNEHIITDGLYLGDLTVYQDLRGMDYLYGCRAIGSESLAYKTYDYRNVILVLNKGSLLLNEGGCNERELELYERNLFFGLPSASEWTPESEELFLNSIDWVLYGDDNDEDGVYNDYDNCINNYNPEQEDSDNDGLGDACDVCPYDGDDDEDNDGVCGDVDNCMTVFNSNQDDFDEDSFGDSCDDDVDDDGISNNADLCGFTSSEFSINVDIDGCADYQLIVINEFESNPKEGSEWIELYNPTNSDIDISNWEIWDGLSSPKKIYIVLESVVLNSNSYYVAEVNNLNNGDEFLTLYDSESNLIDETPTLADSLGSVYTWQRSPNGVDTNSGSDWNFQINTKDMDNDIDVDTPVLNSIGNKNIGENSLLTFVVSGIDYGDELITLSAIGLPFGAIFDTIQASGYVEQIFSWTPSYEDEGEYEVEFIVSDDALNDSEIITITVENTNRAPVLGLIEDQEMDEDEDPIKIILSASDDDGDSLVFSVDEENTNEVDCDVDVNELEITLAENWNGDASCKIKVSDGEDYDEQEFYIHVNPINDKPEITDYNPKEPVVLMENTNETFSIDAFDVEGDSLTFSWFLDGEDLSVSVDNYIFNQLKGDYELRVIISDGELGNEKVWNVFVGDVSDFTCLEVNGFVIGDKETCTGEDLMVSDFSINPCCSVPGSPKFSEIDICEISDKIIVDLKEPDEDEEYSIGEIIDIEVEVENLFEEDLDFEVEVYLYDITDDDEIEKEEDEVDVDEDDSEDLEFQIEIPGDLDADNDYAVFVRVESEDEFCTTDYEKIDIEREDNDVVIRSIDFKQEVECNDNVYFDISFENKGSDDQDVYLLVESSELGINYRGEEFELEEYDEDDKYTNLFNIRMPDVDGIYTLIFSAIYDDGDEMDVVEKDILIDCKRVYTQTSQIQKDVFDSDEEIITKDETRTKVMIVLFSLFTLIFLIIIIFLLKVY